MDFLQECIECIRCRTNQFHDLSCTFFRPARCVRVSKSWRDTFLPYRWRRVRRLYTNSGDSYQYFGPGQEALHNCRHLVWDLSFQGFFIEDEMCTHSHLRSLQIDLSRQEGTYSCDRESFEWDLSVKSPLLRCLYLTRIAMEPRSCWGLLELSHLRSLHLKRVKIKGKHAGIWIVFQ